MTNQSEEQLSAELVAELYRRRWQIELFFRWIKCILGNRHWLAESERGVSLQLYLMGWATLDELMAGIQRERDRANQRSHAKKSQAGLPDFCAGSLPGAAPALNASCLPKNHPQDPSLP